MNKNIIVNEQTLEAIGNLTFLADKEEILSHIDRVIEIAVKSKIAEEYQMSEELGTLFDIKFFIGKLPFSQARQNG